VPGYAELEERAAAVPPGARGLTARLVPADAWTWARWQPPFPPEPTAAGDEAAAGLGERARAIQEAAAYSTRRTAGLVRGLLGPAAAREVLLSGGAARSRLWPQILADVLGCQVSVAGQTETAALGAAILAGRAAGVLPDGTPPAAGPGADGCAAAGPATATAVQPSPARQRAYDDLYAQWISQGYLRSQP
jgi:autoinducer 2 (AI-2) kinase